MILRRLFAVALVGGGLAAAGSAPIQAERWTFDVSPGELLEVELEPGGDVEIRGVAGNVVTIESEVGGRDADDYRISATKTERGVRVEAEMNRRGRSHSIDAGLVITVPDRFDLDLSSSGGGFRISDVEGRIEGDTMGGGLELERVRGEIALKTMGGGVTAREVDARGEVETMGGALHFVDVRGGLEGSTMGGSVTLEGGGRAELSTMGGSVRVRSAPEGAKVSTMGGDVEVESALAPLEATTLGGDLSARIDGGTGDVELSSMSGDLELWLPSGFAADFEVELVQTRGRDGAYTIESDFELERSRETRKPTSRGDYERETVWRAVGASGGGGNRVKLSTVNGDIKIHGGG